MTTKPDIATLLAAGTDRDEAYIRDTVLAPIVAWAAQLPGAAALTELTIASGVVTPTGAIHTVDTESDAAADDLTHLAQDNLPDGAILILLAADASRVPTARDGIGGTGQMLLAGSADWALSTGRALVVQRRGTAWAEIGRWWGHDAAGLRTWLGAAAASDLTALSASLGTAAVENVAAGGTGGLLRADGDGSGLSGLQVSDQVARDMAAVLAWEIARLDGLAVHELVNTVVDVFADETGVDTGGSTGEVYDAAGDYYHNWASGNVFTSANDSNQTQADYHYRQVVNAAATSGGGAKVKVEFEASTAVDLGIQLAYIGKKATAGNDWDFQPGTKVKLTFGGADGTTVPAGDKVLSDAVAFSFADGDNLVIAFDITGSGGMRYKTTVASCVAYRKASTDAASQDAPAGLSDSSVDVSGVSRIVGVNFVDVSLVSNAIAAAAAPATLRPLVDVEEIDAATENTDFLVDVSRDGGTTWSTATLALISGVSASRAVWGADVDVSSQPSATSVKIRFRIANAKNIRLHRWAVQADVELTV